MKQLSWRAKRKGGLYCAPACGYGCTREAYEEALTEAKKLAKKLGKGWKAKVWENLGWHWSVQFGGLKVHPFYCSGKLQGYTAFIGDKDSAGGYWAEGGDTPELAIKNAMKDAKRHIDAYNNALAFAQSASKGRA